MPLLGHPSRELRPRSGRARDAPSLVASAAALLVCSNGCAGAQCKEASAFPPVASIPVAPLPVEGAPVAVPQQAQPAVATMAAAPEETPAPRGVSDMGEAPAGSPLPVAPRVLLVDETPHYAVHWRPQESPDAQHAHTKKRGRHGRPFHPAPGVIVDVVDARGGAPAAKLQRVARDAGYWPFRRCYEEGLRRDQQLAGKVSLDVRVAAAGSVERSTPTGTTLRDDSVVACVAREARSFSLPPSESLTDAAVDVTLSPGDEPVPVARPVPNADRLREALRASWPAIEQCYASELTSHPDAGGHMELHFRVTSGGEIVEVAEEGDRRFGDVQVSRCVLGVYRTTRLPALENATRERDFVYGLHFESVPDPAVQR